MTDKEKLKIVITALKFYADEGNWSEKDRSEDDWIFTYNTVMNCDGRVAGEKARNALTKIGELKAKKKEYKSVNYYHDFHGDDQEF